MAKKVIVLGMLFVLAMMSWSCSSATSPSDQTNVPAVEERSVPVAVDEDDSAPPISDENPAQDTPEINEVETHEAKEATEPVEEAQTKERKGPFDVNKPNPDWDNKSFQQLINEKSINLTTGYSTTVAREYGFPKRVFLLPVVALSNTTPWNLIDIEDHLDKLTPEARDFLIVDKPLQAIINVVATREGYEYSGRESFDADFWLPPNATGFTYYISEKFCDGIRFTVGDEIPFSIEKIDGISHVTAIDVPYTVEVRKGLRNGTYESKLTVEIYGDNVRVAARSEGVTDLPVGKIEFFIMVEVE